MLFVIKCLIFLLWKEFGNKKNKQSMWLLIWECIKPGNAICICGRPDHQNKLNIGYTVIVIIRCFWIKEMSTCDLHVKYFQNFTIYNLF